MSKLQVAVVGAGGKGVQHIGILKSFTDVEIVAVCDPVEIARNSVGDEFRIPNRYSSIDELLDGGSLDAVFATTPPEYNGPVALACVSRGVNTFVEKPPGMTSVETIALRDAAVRTGAKGMVGLNRRFHPMIVEAAELVQERGPIVQLVGEFHKTMTGLEARGKLPEEILDNVLTFNGIHSVDLVRALAGSEVSQVHSVTRRILHKYRDVYAALVEFDNGCVAQFVFNHTSGYRLERYEIHGNDVSAYLDGVDTGVVFIEEERQELPSYTTSGTEEEIRYFVEAILNNTPIGPREDSNRLTAPNFDEAIKSMELAEAILAGGS